MSLRSEGLRSFVDYLKEYLESERYIEMCRRAKKLREELSSVEYCMHIKIPTIRVRRYEGQKDQAKDLLELFSKFKQEDVHDFRRSIPDESQDLRMEATVLNMVAVLYKEIFSELDDFTEDYYNFADETILRFIKEIQFYILWLELIEPLRQKGLNFCYPEMKNESENIYSRKCFDLALALMNKNGDTIVTNDFEMRSPEKIIVITGPNQGGKTTFARAFGQIHHLASLGLCVPGCEAELYLFDRILTHFEREEDLTNLSGMLQDDLMRLRDLFDKATGESIIIINEIFGSTTFMDALSLGKRMMTALDRLDALALVVTFLDELATHSPKTVSMMSTVDEEDPGKRTFKIVRKPPDGLAYAMHLAKRHAVTYEQIIGRLAQ
jgi:DNA mismatch repair ATPase MutS